ncbi:Hpt domain-containing protein [Roseibium polysiphoniae]|uniref:Hpt domain-containing protein n=1 Tax=Roseibium polysiphoniae TaxID=2571221 RepID=UPI003298D60E
MSADLFEGEEYELVTPPSDLRKKVRIMNKREAAKFDPVKAAEIALERLSQNFGGWMSNEAAELMAAWDVVQSEGLTAENLDTLYQSAHNIKGQALTLGYPLVGSVAASFCRLIETVPSPSALPLPLVEQYVVAIRAMVAEGAKDDQNETGSALLDRLTEVTEDYLAQLEK